MSFHSRNARHRRGLGRHQTPTSDLYQGAIESEYPYHIARKYETRSLGDRLDIEELASRSKLIVDDIRPEDAADAVRCF